MASATSQLVAARARQAQARLRGAYDARLEKLKAKNRETVAAQRSDALITGAGQLATAAVGSQVYREAAKRDKAMLGRILNYGAGGAGLVVAYNGKKRNARLAGASMVGMAAGQLFFDLSGIDLVPGFNE